jgi:acetylornithine deacetylase/succinyl-diaminopimelate desuccinylase-like protein
MGAAPPRLLTGSIDLVKSRQPSGGPIDEEAKGLTDARERDLQSLVAPYCEPMISFCRQMVQRPSLPGEEGEVAALVKGEMESLGYDEVWVDDWGNVVGLLRGTGAGRSVMFNGHMDHVDAGRADEWPHPPFGGEIHDDRLWGRGAADMKAPLGAMVYAVGLLAQEGLRPPDDVYVAGVVQEEVAARGWPRPCAPIWPWWVKPRATSWPEDTEVE